jgi:hypothetical protein
MQEERHATQVNDDLELLELMMRDREFAPMVYKIYSLSEQFS